MTEIVPPPIEPDMQSAFRLMSYTDLVNLLCSRYGFNRFSLREEEYIETHHKTRTFIRRGLRPL